MLNARGKLLPSVFCLLSSVFCLSFPEAATGATYYLDDTNGLDTNTGVDWAHSWKTIARAQNYRTDPNYWPSGYHTRVMSGDMVWVKNGSYGTFDENDGNNPRAKWYIIRTDWITYKAAPGHTPTLTSIVINNEDAWNTPKVHGSSYLIFDGFNITNPSNTFYGISFEYTSYVKILNCNVQEKPVAVSGYYEPYFLSNSAVIHSVDANHVTVQDCNIWNGYRGIGASGNDWLIHGNTIHCVAEDEIEISGIYDGITIEDNLIYDNRPVKSATSIYGTKTGDFSEGDVLTMPGTSATGIVKEWNAGSSYLDVYPTSEATFYQCYVPAYGGSHDHNVVTVTATGATLNITAVDWPHCDGIQVTVITHPLTNLIIRRNIIDMQRYGGPGTDWATQAIKLDAYAKCISGSMENNVAVGTVYAFLAGGLNNFIINNNVLIDWATTYNAGFDINTNYADSTISQMYNNIITYFNIRNDGTGHTVTVTGHGNNIYKSVTAGPWGFAVNGTEKVLVSDLNMEALFVDFKTDTNEASDFRLVLGSLAINFGNANYGPSTDILGKSRVGAPDAGCYEYVASEPNSQSYNLNITAVNGSVVKSPDKASYNPGETVTLQATPNAGYHFVNWSGDASGTNTSVTITMDSNKSVTANFAINTYTLNVTATNGSVSKTPNKSFYNHGETVTLGATANTGYHFSNWSGDASGTNSTTTIVMNSNKSVTANFSLNTYSLTVTSSNGSVTRTPDKTPYNYGEMVTIQAFSNTGYDFTGWAGDASGSSNPVTLTMDSNKSVTANFVYTLVDKTPPSITGYSPQPGSIQIPLNSLIVLHITDAGKGVDANSVIIKVNSDVIYSGDTLNYSSVYGNCRRSGAKADYTYVYQSNEMFDFDQTVTVTVNAADLAGNVMSHRSYSFTTDMRSFGQNKKVGSGSDTLSKAAPATVPDSAGNIWAAWHAGSAGSRDIYVGKLAAGADNFGSSIRLTASTADQCNPAIAIGSDDKLYVAWQDNRIGTWDIYVSTSSDGITWSTERRVTDTNDNQVNPAIAVDNLNRAYIVWQDDRNRNQDIYIAVSSNGFVTETVSQITSNIANQIEPAIAVDSSNTVYVVWTDARNGSSDVYGAASNKGPWTNVPIVSSAGSQSSPAIAAGPEGSILHLLWVDDRSGNQDIYYATSNGLPSAPLSGSSIIDDASRANQLAPAIVTNGSSKVFASWQDRRNITDTDLYFAELTSGSRTNIFVGDDSTNADQSEPAMGIGEYGHPYLVWTDGRSANTEIYYAASTFIEPVALKAKDVSASLGATVGTDPASISSVDDVSVVVPLGAYLCDVKITISKIKNPQTFATQCLGSYDFGPSGIQFSQPVTVTIPYTFSASGTLASAYWYNSLTGALSQQGITSVENIQISSTLYALRFETTHFTPCYLLGGSTEADDGGSSSGGGGGGGGGCSISAGGEANFLEFTVPYIGLSIIMVILKLRDRRNQKTRSNTESKC